MAKHFGDVPANSTLPIFFDTISLGTGSVTITGLATSDIEVYKGTSMTQRASDNGYALIDTDGIDVDGITGVHGFSIDLSDNSDAGFYAVGSFYTVVVSSITVDGQTVNFIAATFRIVAAQNVSGVTNVNVTHWSDSGIAVVSVGGVPEVDITYFGGTVGTFASGRPEVNATSLDGNATAAQKINAWTQGLISGTAGSGSTTTMVDAARTETATDYWKGSIIVFRDGTLTGQARLITAFNPTTDTITFAPATTSAVSTHTYIIIPHGQVDLWGLLGTVMATPTVAGVPKAEVTAISDTGINDRLARIGFDADTGLRDRINDLDTGIRDYIDNTDTGLRKYLDNLDTGISATNDTGAILNAIFENTRVDGRKFQENVRLWNAVLGGVVTGAGTGTEIFRKTNDTGAARVTATVDALGNRSALTYALDT